MAPVSQVLDSARMHLNDMQGQLWQDQKLIPFLQEGFREMTSALLAAGIPIVNEVTTVITVPALVTDDANLDMSTVAGYPTDLVAPIWMKERQVGEMNADFVDMTQCDFIPNVGKDTELIWWAWIEQTIMLLGATVDTQVQLRYRRNLNSAMPKVVTDDTVVTQSEIFLSYRTAALACYSIGDYSKGDNINKQAQWNLDKIIRMNIKWEQNLPAKRRPYHRGRGRNVVVRDF